MKDWLILLCIGVIAFLLFQERGRWTSQKTVAVPMPAPEVEKSSPPPPQEGKTSGDPASAPVAQNAGPSPEKEALANLVIESQRAALVKYPSLGVPNSELNIRFTYRYRTLVADHSPRLQDPGWPVELADECAHDAGVRPVAQPAAPPPAAVPVGRAAAQPVSLTAPANTPAPSLRIEQPAAAVPQTLVFHPAPAGTPPVVSAPAPAAAPKSTTLPFVTLGAVNQSSGNNARYNYNSAWYYDVSFRQSVGIAINVRNMGREPAAVNVRWLFFARRGYGSDRFVFGAAGKELDLTPGQSVDVPAASPVVQSREVSDYWWNGTRYLSGSKYEGWLVQLVERGSNRVIKQTGSSGYLEDLAKRTDFSTLIEKFKNGQSDGSVGSGRP